MCKRIVLGLSGGMDSAYAAISLMDKGYSVLSVYLKMDDRCDRTDEAKDLALFLGVDFLSVDVSDTFERAVIHPFVKDYAEGRTPNPCILCNPEVKFRSLADIADAHGINEIATGHYAAPCSVNGRYSLAPAADPMKDQGYFLYRLPQNILSRVVMPLSCVKKSSIRSYFNEYNRFIFPHGESADICFASGDYRSVVERYGVLQAQGDFVDENGVFLGKHSGIHNYTVGQRKGLGIALGRPAFVTKIDPITNRVVLAFADKAVSYDFRISDVNYLSREIVDKGERFKVRVRYRAVPVYCTVTAVDNGYIDVRFDEPQKVTAPGQSAVFYDEDGIIAFGGIIRR